MSFIKINALKTRKRGLQDKCNRFHPSIRQPLLERNSKLLESFASLLDVINRDADVTKSSTRFSISIRVTFEVGVGFGSMIPSSIESVFYDQKIWLRSTRLTIQVRLYEQSWVVVNTFASGSGRRFCLPSRLLRLFALNSAVSFPSERSYALYHQPSL
jgi:hypothetical protein